jgi:hypothetical protein
MSETAWPGEFAGSSTFGSCNAVHVVRQACTQVSVTVCMVGYWLCRRIPRSLFSGSWNLGRVTVGMGAYRVSESDLKLVEKAFDGTVH